jgi:DNA-binding NarL/FixJ family response regulator
MSKTFIVIEPDPVVGLDLVEMLRSAHPKCDVVVLGTLLDALGRLQATGAGAFVLINSAAAADRSLAMLRDVVVRGGRVVFIGRQPDIDFPATVVETPFTSAMIMNALLPSEGDQPVHQPAGHT